MGHVRLGQLPKTKKWRQVVELIGKDDEYRKVTLQIGDIRRSLYKEIPDRFHDLLEMATYVYCADQEVTRGQQDATTFGSNWRRHFHFVIPVRDIAFWQSTDVANCLKKTLGFLSDDKHEFEFVEAKERVSFQQFLNFNEKGAMFGFPEQVIMFSGGLDSLFSAIIRSLTWIPTTCGLYCTNWLALPM